MVWQIFSGGDAQAETASSASCSRIGVVTEQDALDAKQHWIPTVDYLNQNIKDYCFELKIFDPQYALTAVKEKEADFFVMSPVVFSEIGHLVPLESYLTMERTQGGFIYPLNGAVVFTRSDHQYLNYFRDLRDNRAIVLKTEGMQGELAFLRELTDLHMNPAGKFKQYTSTANYKEICSAVLRGEYDIGVSATGDLEQCVVEKLLKWKDVKVLEPYQGFRMGNNYNVPFRYSTRLYADWVFVSVEHLPSLLIRDTVGALLNVPENAPAALSAGYAGWLPDLSYQDVHDALQNLKRGPRNWVDIQNAFMLIWKFYRWGIISVLCFLIFLIGALLYLMVKNIGLYRVKQDLARKLVSQKNIEDGAQETEAKIDAILNAIPYAVIGFENDVIIFANGAVKKMFGRDPESLIGKTAEILYSGANYINVLEEIYGTLKNEQTLSKELRAIRKNGEKFDCLVSVAQLKNDKSQHRFVGVFVDVTERYNREELLRKLSKAIQQNPAGVIIASPAGRIEYVNDRFLQISGWDRNSVLNVNIQKLIVDLLMDGKSTDFWKMVVNGQLTQKEFFSRRKNAELYWGMFTVSPLKDNEGGITHFVFNWEDISERKKTEEKFKVSQQELERANKNLVENEKTLKNMIQDLEATHRQLKTMQAQLIQTEKLSSIGQLAAGIAHEINNPVAFITSNINALERYLVSFKKIFYILKELENSAGGEDSRMARDIFKKLERVTEEEDINFILKDIDAVIAESKEGLERIKNIVLDMKTFSRRDDLSRMPADINHILDGVINIVWNEIKYKAKLVKNFQPLPLINCNPQQIGQVFMNLLINAVQAIDEQGQITVSTYLKNNFAVVEIADTGRGIPADVRGNIFEPFYTTKKTGESTGLGLSISLEIINRHQGKIDLESEIGKGTTFIVRLPVV
ncbi:MAG: PAS domain S-box protein [Candidatus Omnitrophica bacterium]|nr:PAS domain S-box protein [Candidatus Omnitrophota bacterium]